MSLDPEMLRKEWKDFQGNEKRMSSIRFGKNRIVVATDTAEAWLAMYAVMRSYGYQIRSEDTEAYSDRPSKTSGQPSLHSFGIALDVNYLTNPIRNGSKTKTVKFSDRDSQEDRAQDVRNGDAGTDMSSAMIDDILAIKTKSGEAVLVWGGMKDPPFEPMHFNIGLDPVQLKSGIDWSTVRGPIPVLDTDDDGEVEPDEIEDFYDRMGEDDPDDGDGEPALEIGDKGPLVKALQMALTGLGYHLGGADGKFGRMTRDALLAFQADNDIPITGEYDRDTIRVLENGRPRPLDPDRMNASELELITRGSQTLRKARWNRWLGMSTVGLGALGLTDTNFKYIERIVAALKENVGETAAPGGMLDSVLDLAQGLLSSDGNRVWALLAAAGVSIWRNSSSTTARRLQDHLSGANRRH